MLFRLLLYRMGPLTALCFLKDRKKIKMALYGGILCWVLCFIMAALKIFEQARWKGLLALVLSMVPHYLFYGFSLWMIVRCVRSAWSKRVWRRICLVSYFCIMCGILSESYINSLILNFFVKNF